MNDFIKDIIHNLDLKKFEIIQFILVALIGIWVIRIIMKITEKSLKKSKINQSVHGFIKGIVSISLKILLIITLAALLNIETNTFVAIFSACGLAIALALKDNLSNFASGILIVFFHPFEVGDFIENQGSMGTVKDIQLLYTYLITPDNKKIIIPNNELTNSKVINFSSEATRRVDLIFGVDYNSNIKEVKQILSNIVDKHPLILEEKDSIIRLAEHGDSSLNYHVKVWCLKENYWAIYYDLHEQVKNEFDKHNISIPFPQRDLHMINDTNIIK